MAITWRTDYAIRLLYELARLGAGERATVRTIAELADVPYDFARVISHDLVQAGLLRSRRGVGGGVELAHDPGSVTLKDVFVAMEEPMSLALCTSGASDICSRTKKCPMHNGVWTELDRRIEEYLAGTTLSECVRNGEILVAASS